MPTRFQGPAVSFGAKAALGLSLVFHELATNASKYGALTTPEGTIEVTWKIVDGEEGKQLHLTWHECGGPAVDTPTRTGFGSTLIDFNITHEFDGRINRDFREDGLVCELVFPLPTQPADARSLAV